MSRKNIWYGLVALAIATILWGMAHGTSFIERGVDVPVVFTGIPDHLVITDQSNDVVNVRVLGSRAALRNLSPTKMEYRVDVSGGRPGVADYEVDISRINLPRGARIVSRSPSRLEVKFERRGKKAVKIRADLEGAPAEGFELKEVVVEPPRVWLVGARGDVLRLNEVVTETIDITDIDQSEVREVRLSLGNGHVWMEEQRPVAVRIEIEPVPEAGADEQQEGA